MLAQNNAPVITNVDLQQRTDGSMLVDIYYDVYDADENLMEISMKASSDSGATWNLSCNNLTGAVGTGISSGTGKHIVWDVSVEHPNFFSNKVIVEIAVDDGILSCGSQITYSGKTYNTVQIGTQCWLRENLDVGTRINGSNNQTNNSTIEKYCYGDIDANCNTYGGLYQWNEAMQYVTTPGIKGICPEGWHIPTYAEFETLRTTVSNNGNSLKAIGQGTGSGAGTNTSGFTSLLAGFRYYYGIFYFLGDYSFFWSSTEGYSNYAGFLGLNYTDSNITLYYDVKEYGFSIRCVKD